MGSSWQTFCDEVIDDLVTNVPALRDVLQHRYSPWDPEEQIAEAGERHLAVYPIGTTAQEAAPFVTDGGAQMVEIYRISYWEDAGSESSRGISDQDAAAKLFELAEDVRDRFYKMANLTIGDSSTVRYIGTAFPERSGQTRWFAIGVRATREVPAT